MPSTATLVVGSPLYYLHLPMGKKSEILMVFLQLPPPHLPAEAQRNEPVAQTRSVKLHINIEERKDVAKI